jgi:hypothetical protein
MIKKFLSFLFAGLMLLMLVSCDTYAQIYSTNDGVTYEYSCGTSPVMYVRGTAYYYVYYDNMWTWRVLPRDYYNIIIHHEPRFYRHSLYYNNYMRGPVIHHYPSTERLNEHRRSYNDRRGGFSHQGGRIGGHTGHGIVNRGTGRGRR